MRGRRRTPRGWPFYPAVMRDWWLPAAFAVAQLLYWPGVRSGPGPAVVVALGVVAVVVLALGRRRRAPVTVTAVVAAALGVGELTTAGDHLLVIGCADLAALFAVAVSRDRRLTVLTVAGLVAVRAVLAPVSAGSAFERIADVLLNAAAYGIVAVLGRVRRRWLADREAAARRLAEARAGEREAVRAERGRLARELHDVTAHHLTSIVVSASAAQALAHHRPELTAEALAYASRTGRETLASLHRLVSTLPPGPAAEDGPEPADLVDDFRLLGQRVTLETIGRPGSAVAEAVHGILREALTNTVRYAAGSTVRVRITTDDDATELLVENDAGEAPGPGGLGGGRGLPGMRERAELVGGTLGAGPSGSGWRVHARLPVTTAATARRRPHSLLAFDIALTATTMLVPVLIVLGVSSYSPAVTALLIGGAAVHSAPLVVRRQHPWWTLVAVAAVGWLLLLLVAAHTLPLDGAECLAFGAGAELAAVYAVAAWGRRPQETPLAPVAVSVSGALLASAAFLLAYGQRSPGENAASAAVIAGLVAPPLGLATFGSWLAGWAVRRRRDRRRHREEQAVDGVTFVAGLQTLGERARMAAGLRTEVLRHAAHVPRAADRADLTEVVSSARLALSAMRTLLNEKRDEEAPPSPPG